MYPGDRASAELNYLDNNMAKDARIEKAFHEVYSKVPKTVKATGKTGEAKRKMMTAVALSKARAAGAKIPMNKGGDSMPSSPMSVTGGKARMTIGMVPPSIDHRIPAPMPYPAGSKPSVGPAGGECGTRHN